MSLLLTSSTAYCLLLYSSSWFLSCCVCCCSSFSCWLRFSISSTASSLFFFKPFAFCVVGVAGFVDNVIQKCRENKKKCIMLLLFHSHYFFIGSKCTSGADEVVVLVVVITWSRLLKRSSSWLNCASFSLSCLPSSLSPPSTTLVCSDKCVLRRAISSLCISSLSTICIIVAGVVALQLVLEAASVLALFLPERLKLWFVL